MAYNDQLAHRIRKILRTNSGRSVPEPIHQTLNPTHRIQFDTRLEERQLFGGLVFLVNGKMAFAVVRDDIIVRTNQSHTNGSSSSLIELLSSDGKPIHGWALISKANHRRETDLQQLLTLGINNTYSVGHTRDLTQSLQ